MKGTATPTLVLLLTAMLLAGCAPLMRVFMTPGDPPAEQQGATLPEDVNPRVETVAECLEIPWEIAFLPDGDMLVTERAGRLIRLPARGDIPVRPQDGKVWSIEGVHHDGEGGLMGMALHPGFADNGWIYLMHTSRDAGRTINRVVRYRLTEDGPTDPETILDGIPAAYFHNGGRIAFGPDRHLYITTGDAFRSERAQNRDALGGKILRITDAGYVPPDNPFGTWIWSWGHRNPQGLDWDEEGRL